MSAKQDPTPQTSDDFFTGSYILLSIVPDPSNPTNERFVGCITEGPTFSSEFEEAEATLKCRGGTLKISTSATHEMELSIAQDPGYPALEKLGLKDPDTGKMLGPNQVPLVRVRYYYGDPDPANPSKNLAQGKEFEEVEFKVTEDSAEAGEIAVIQFTASVNGDIFYALRTGGSSGGGSGGGGSGGSGGGGGGGGTN